MRQLSAGITQYINQSTPSVPNTTHKSVSRASGGYLAEVKDLTLKVCHILILPRSWQLANSTTLPGSRES